MSIYGETFHFENHQVFKHSKKKLTNVITDARIFILIAEFCEKKESPETCCSIRMKDEKEIK